MTAHRGSHRPPDFLSVSLTAFVGLRDTLRSSAITPTLCLECVPPPLWRMTRKDSPSLEDSVLSLVTLSKRGSGSAQPSGSEDGQMEGAEVGGLGRVAAQDTRRVWFPHVAAERLGVPAFLPRKFQ